MRGEDTDGWSILASCTGSPPHARGRLRDMARDSFLVRITPACAGKTAWLAATSFHVEDHPRMRGEDDKEGLLDVARDGSPPHARGRHRINIVYGVPPGITPACAGKTSQ